MSKNKTNGASVEATQEAKTTEKSEVLISENGAAVAKPTINELLMLADKLDQLKKKRSRLIDRRDQLQEMEIHNSEVNDEISSCFSSIVIKDVTGREFICRNPKAGMAVVKLMLDKYNEGVELVESEISNLF